MSLVLITLPNSAGVDDPGVPYPESLRCSLQDAHDHARAALSASHSKKKRYYDKKRRSVSYAVDDLVRVKTHPKSDAGANFTAKLAPVYAGPFRISKKLSSVNYRLANVDTGEDAGVFHVVNLQPFHSWDTAVPTTSSYADVGISLPLGEDFDYQTGSEESGNADQSVGIDYSNESLYRHSDENSPECCTGHSLDLTPDIIDGVGVSDSHDLTSEAVTAEPANQGLSRYALRPRRVPRVTSDWTVNKWTNPYHVKRFDLD